MNYKNVVIISICSFLLIACENSSQRQIIEELKIKNDSLSSILNVLNKKYIFDSISIRDIPSFQNTYRRNSNVVGEIVIVGFNNNQKTNVVFSDSISYNPEIRLHNPDTLEMKNGGFIYSKELVDNLLIKGVIEVGNNYGKSRQVLYNSEIMAKDR